MRILTDHIVPGDSVNHQLRIEVRDEPGSGGACHLYFISGFNTKTNSSDEVGQIPFDASEILFQNGPIKEVGVNGVTQEALIAICIDRLKSFQAGPYASDLNGLALEHLQFALENLQQRTRLRIARGVEGTHEK